MQEHYPRGSRLSALEKNELKRRSLEMVLLLFYVEDLKQFVISSIQATERTRREDRGGHRLQKGTRGLYKAAWALLVDTGILTQEESDELEKLVDYRNLVAHQIYNLTGDISCVRSIQIEGDRVRYQFDALKRARYLHEKVSALMGRHFTLSLSFRSLWFEAAERTYTEELKRLNRKIQKQAKDAQHEMDEVNATIFRLRQSGLIKRLQPGHPHQTGRNGRLTGQGINCCKQLFDAGASRLVVAHLMRMSLRAITKQYRAWRAAA